MAQVATPVETQRVKFLVGGVTVGLRTYNKGDVADIPTDRLKSLGKKVTSTGDDLTDFDAVTPAVAAATPAKKTK